MAKDPRFDPKLIRKKTDKSKKEDRTDDKILGKEIANNTILTEHLVNGAVTSEKLSNKIVIPGTLVWPNRPAFLVGWNGSISVSPTPIVIPLNGTVTFNRGNHLNTSTNRFVCPIEGLYMFGFSYLRNPSAIVVRANLYKNGSVLNQQLRTPEGFTGYNYTAGQWYIAYGNVSDYFELRISADQATTLYNDGGGLSYNWFCGYLVG